MKNILIIVLLVFGKNAIAQITKTDVLLCNKQWKMIAWTVTPAMDYRNENDLITDLLKNERTCLKDDYYVFTFNKKYSLLNGEQHCTETENDVVSKGTWEFLKNDSTVLNMRKEGNGGFLQKQIIVLTAEKLSYSTTLTKNKITYTFTETFENIKNEKIKF